MRGVVEWLVGQFPDLHMTVETIVAEGDTVVARVASAGTNLGPLQGIMPATGKRFSAEQSHWYRVDDTGRPLCKLPLLDVAIRSSDLLSNNVSVERVLLQSPVVHL